MLPDASRIAPEGRRALPSRIILAYGLAIVLPNLASVVTAHSPVLLTIPFALYFISLSIIAILGGLGPALVGVAACVVSRYYFIAPGERLLSFNAGGLYRLTVLLACAILVSGIDRRRRMSADSLAVALDDLQERSEALMVSLQNAKCASWSRDFSATGNIQWYRGSYLVFGRPFPADQDQSALLSWIHPEDHQALIRFVETMRNTTEPLILEYRVIWPNGETHWLEARATRAPGVKNVWRGLTVDITERKLTELTLLRSEKLAAMGRLASTVAHEINNPLESVTNLLYLARLDPKLTSDTRAYLATAELELARLGDITRLTLGFVRNSSVRTTLEIATVADEVLSIFRHRLEGKGITVIRDFAPEVEIFFAPHELRQILTNLVSNAADALQGPNAKIRIQVFREPGRSCLTVEDNGCGIPSEILARIFEPFFTTKQDVGTGIGLWVTRELVESNGGHITAECGSLPLGMRTRFRLDFPSPAATA